jgi:HlyD family secretion protein
MAKRKRTTILLISLISLIVLLVVASVWRSRTKAKGEKVTVESVVLRTIDETVAASGRIFPETEVNISSDVSGEVVELYVEEGDSVFQGQLLARVDPDAFQSAVDRGRAAVDNAKAQLANARAGVERNIAARLQAEAQVKQVEAQLVNARTVHQRNEGLLKDGVVSQADFDASLSNLQVLEANLESAKANLKAADATLESARQSSLAAGFTVKSAEASLKELQTSLRRTSIYAPVDGVVSRLNIEKGERVVGTIQMAGTEMMRIADMSRMEVQVDVNENDVLRVNVGDQVDVEVDAYLDQVFRGTVTQIANSASSATALSSDQVTNFVVKVLLDPASWADLRLPSSDGTVSLVPVTTGIQDDEYIEVTSGLAEGMEIVTGPYSAVSRILAHEDAIQRKEAGKESVDDE